MRLPRNYDKWLTTDPQAEQDAKIERYIEKFGGDGSGYKEWLDDQEQENQAKLEDYYDSLKDR